MKNRNEPTELSPSTQEQRFKEHLLELGLLTEITPPLPADAHPKNRRPAPVSSNVVSELVIKERR